MRTGRDERPVRRGVCAALAALLAGCADDPERKGATEPTVEPENTEGSPVAEDLDRAVTIADGRSLYLRCTVEVPAPFPNPPADIVAATRWNAPENVESRDYLQVEKDAWAARQRVGDIPVTVISNRYSVAEIAAAPSPGEKQLMRTNVRAQRGWFELSPQAEQVVVRTGHAVEEVDPQLVIDEILAVVEEARG